MANTFVEFDQVASIYEQQHAASIRISGEAPDFFAHYKIELADRSLGQAGKKPNDIMDFGAGVGNSIPHLRTHFPAAEITALDVSKESLKFIEKSKFSKVKTLAYNGLQIPSENSSYDMIFTACVFHHIEEQYHVELLKEIRRTLRESGNFILFEHNPWNPLTRYAVANCPFDENAVLISAPELRRRLLKAGFRDVRIRYCMFFPKFLAVLRPLERFMTWLPAGAQYMLEAR